MGIIGPRSKVIKIKGCKNTFECYTHFAIEHIRYFDYVTENGFGSRSSKVLDFDSIGIRDAEGMEEQFERNINFQDGKYTVNLPFRDENPTLPNNYNIAANRLDTLSTSAETLIR